MSAIVGLLQLDDAPADIQVIRAMAARIAHRGPDGSGAFASGPVALGHLLLQIAPESIGERQPLASPDGANVISFDGRIDNREDLWEALSVPASERGNPDAALVLGAYQKWGGECPERLLGEFAFAIWDGRKRELFCARDAFGARNFTYHKEARRFAFSSEINAVLAVPGVPRRLDEQALACSLGILGGLGERTLYEGVVNLPPAHSLSVSQGSGLALRRYWQLAMEPELRLRSNEEYAEALREIITKAVSCRLRCSHPIASTLSGGLDSSGVTCVAARQLQSQGRRLLTVSNTLPPEFRGHEWLREEREFIQRVNSQEPNIDPCLLHGERYPAIEFGDQALERLGQPVVDPFDFRTRELVAAAQERGSRLLLGGLGGDMAASFKGTGWLEELARRGRLLELVRHLRLRGRAQGVPSLSILKREVIHPLIPLGARLWRNRLRVSGIPGWNGTAVNPRFAARMRLDDQLRELELDEPPQDRRRLLLKLTSRGWVPPQNSWVASHGDTIEGPQPLMDRRIWEFAYRVPLEQFCSGGMPRSLYRRALTGILPEKILHRTTKGWFAPDYRQRMLACRPQMRAFLDAHKPDDPIWGYVDRPSVEMALLHLERPGPPNQANIFLQSALGLGLRMAHFLSWLRRTG